MKSPSFTRVQLVCARCREGFCAMQRDGVPLPSLCTGCDLQATIQQASVDEARRQVERLFRAHRRGERQP